MGVVYNAGRGLIIAGIITLIMGALASSKYIPGDANLLGEYSYLFLLSGVIVIAVSTKLDFLDYGKEEKDEDIHMEGGPSSGGEKDKQE
ncbi:MAG: hypothetical protein QW514_04725 [Thermoprotei archaeon]